MATPFRRSRQLDETSGNAGHQRRRPGSTSIAVYAFPGEHRRLWNDGSAAQGPAGAGWLGLAEGGTLLVVGATGGVGSHVLQPAATRGVRVIAVAAGEDDDHARTRGAAEVIDRRPGDVADAVRAAHPDGIDAVLDLVDDRDVVMQKIAPLVRDGGRLATTVFALRHRPGNPGRPGRAGGRLQLSGHRPGHDRAG
ncbi:zinc-binding dehydrogenase [Streptomyces sp. NPDC007369]|uniref:zinc-binding dehydrogenase n=1 Tax=Streptomyces sp. NPDC007369 TaxID=3154589 RepID=UPI0033F68E85